MGSCRPCSLAGALHSIMHDWKGQLTDRRTRSCSHHSFHRELGESRTDGASIHYPAVIRSGPSRFADLFASDLPSILAVIVRFTEAGTNAFMMRFNRPGMILERFTRNAFRPSDTHCSTLIGFIGMVRGSNPSLASTAVFVSGAARR